MEEAISKLKVRYSRPDGQIREYRVNDKLGPSSNDPKKVQGKMTVAAYFK